MYYFSNLALTLNEPEDGLAPTDSRLRPDQRLMENGKWDEANVEKQRLEEKQRAVRRRREAEAVEALEEGGSGSEYTTKGARAPLVSQLSLGICGKGLPLHVPQMYALGLVLIGTC